MAMTVLEVLANGESLLGEQIIVEGYPVEIENGIRIQTEKEADERILVDWGAQTSDDVDSQPEESELQYIIRAEFSRLQAKASHIALQGKLVRTTSETEYALTDIQYAIAESDDRGYVGYFKTGGIDFDFIGFDYLPLTSFEDLINNIDDYIGKPVRLEGILTGYHAWKGRDPSNELCYLVGKDHLARLHNLRMIYASRGEAEFKEKAEKQKHALRIEKQHSVYLKYKGIFSTFHYRIAPRGYVYSVQMIGTLDKSELEPFAAAFQKHDMFIASFFASRERKSQNCIHLWNPVKFPEIDMNSTSFL